MKPKSFGKIILFGSGETSDSGRVILRKILKTLPEKQDVAILETPAGFQPNSHLVANEIADIFQTSLSEFVNSVEIIPARKKGSKFSPDNPFILKPLIQSNFILMGPGSPTYAVRQLSNSRLWKFVIKRWQKGATLCFSSAGALACSKFTLPAYEIYKAGEDLHWINGLNIFGKTGWPLTIITHWNNNEGGRGLDTRFCYMGINRFDKLHKLLPPEQSIIGIDENTALIFDFTDSYFYLEGKGSATLINNDKRVIFKTDNIYSLESITSSKIIGKINPGLSGINHKKPALDLRLSIPISQLPNKVQSLIRTRQKYKLAKKFVKADEIREILQSKGYELRDGEIRQEIYKI